MWEGLQWNPMHLLTVSVITYNHERYIAECLDGILGQATDFPFKVRVSDDCSSDGTADICRAYAARDPRVEFISRCGMPKSRFEGRPTGNQNFIENIQAANGEFVAVCDGDDVWPDPHKLQAQVDFLRAHPCVAIVASNKHNIVDGALVERPGVPRDVILPWWVLCFFNPLPSSSVVFRRGRVVAPPAWFYDGLDVGDWPLWFMVARGAQVARLSRYFMHYRIHSGGTWGEKRLSGKARSARRVIARLQADFPNPYLALGLFLQTVRVRLCDLIEWRPFRG